jgi:probable lipoprotein (TIGR04455 family)
MSRQPRRPAANLFACLLGRLLLNPLHTLLGGRRGRTLLNPLRTLLGGRRGKTLPNSPSPLLGGLLCAASLSCSSLGAVYLQPGYGREGPAGKGPAPQGQAAQSAGPVKRLVVAGWAHPAQTGLGEVLAAMGTDMVKLRKNYLVYEPEVIKIQWAEACRDHVEGVLLVRSLNCRGDNQTVTLHLVAELLRCSNGDLLWRGEAKGTHSAHDANLVEATSHYTSVLGSAAALYTAPAFGLLQDLVAAMPEPTLDDAEVAEKIELGSL